MLSKKMPRTLRTSGSMCLPRRGEHIYRSRRDWLNWTPAEGGALWDGKKGFCPERWALWKERFKWVAEQGEMMDEARDLAAKWKALGMESTSCNPSTFQC